MFLRFLFTLSLVIASLYAQPTVAQVKQAVSQNPALLETPQAKAMMKEKGVSLSEVKQKLAEDKASVKDSSSETTVSNTIDTTVDEGKKSDDTTNKEKIHKTDSLAKRVNPFRYRTNQEVRTETAQKQQKVHSSKLHRYSMSFYANKNKLDSSSLPTPDDYIMSVGDKIGIHIYGDRDEHYSVEIKNDGTIDLAFIGPVKLGGMEFATAKKHLIHQLKNHFKMSDFNINIDKYSTIQVTLIGDVKYPGLYNLSSFSTVKDLLITAKGVRDSASVRNIIVKRNSKVIAKLDFYDLLFKGKNFSTVLLKHGDIVQINQAKKLVNIDGYVNNAAQFELTGNEDLRKLIEYSGGLKPDASKSEIKISRFDNNEKIKTFKVSYAKSKNFKLKDGDSVYIYPLDFTAKNSVNLYGNVIRPGTYSLHNVKTLHEFFKSAITEGVKKFFLPNTYFEYGVIRRYTDDLQYTSKSFNLANVINGTEKVSLQPSDEVFIFNFSDIYANAYVATKGTNLIHPGKLQYIEGMTIQDALNASGISGILDDKVKVTTYETEDYMPKTTFYSLKTEGSKVLSAYDEVEVYDYYATHILKPISISGEVVKPLSSFYEKDMNVQDLVNMAGGLTNKAYINKLEIVRYFLDASQTRQRKILDVSLKGKNLSQIALKAYDEVKIFKIPAWGEKKTIELTGEVKFPGVYSIENGEKLSSVIKRAGGYTKNAFLEGAVFTRESIRKKQLAEYHRSLSKIKRQLALYNSMPANAKSGAVSNSTASALDGVIAESKKYQPIGRVSVNVQKDLQAFQNSKFDLVLKDKDKLFIPSQIDTITVFGEVFNPTSFVFDAAKSVDEYIAMASGLARSADESNIYVIHANGISEPVSKSWFSSSIEIQKGDTIVVPIYIKETSNLDLWDSVSRIFASFAVTAATLNTLGVI